MREINSIEIKDAAQVGAARRVVHGFAGRLGFDENQLAEIDIVVQPPAAGFISRRRPAMRPA
jgi:anti-sigma regulatory factor (Ser/Thr protein kinase)